MPVEPPANNANTFRIALLAMLLSIWLIGRASLRQETELIQDDPVVLETPERGDPVTLPIVPPVEVDANTPGRVEGIVKFVGQWPAHKPIIVDLDPYCARLYQGREELLFERWVMGEHETVQNTFIHITAGLPEKSWPVPQESAVIELHECRFKPHITVVQREQVIEIRNLDQTLHSADLVPAINRGLTPSPSQRPTDITLWMPEKTELGIYLKCNIHPWMNGYIHVLDHPYYDVTGPQGTYEINDLPPGEYELSLWHELKTFRESVKPVKVKIEPGKTTKIDFTIEQKSKSVE